MFKAMYLFYIFKFKPIFIETDTFFWGRQVRALNKQRRKNADAFYLWRIGRLCMRDPFSTPYAGAWTSSKRHPFCWKK